VQLLQSWEMGVLDEASNDRADVKDERTRRTAPVCASVSPYCTLITRPARP